MQLHRIVNSVFTSNTYILYEPHFPGACLIDIGDTESVKTYLVKHRLTAWKLFLTHTHYDHIYGLPELMKSYPDCRIYTSEFGKEALKSDKWNFSRYHNDPIIYEGSNIEITKEGDRTELFPGAIIETIETPGHDPSCLTYSVGTYLFSGDSFIPGVKVVTSFPRSNRSIAETSAQRIIKMAKGCMLCPGHGAVYDHLDHEQAQYIP